MKKLNIGGNLLKALLLAGLMTGCQNEDALMPADSNAVTMTDENAKTNAELKLVKDGWANIQYIKQGRFTGKLSKVSKTAEYIQYTYDDATGDLWVTSKRYSKANGNLLEEIKYKVTNGRCVISNNITSGWTSQFKYNETGRLDEINMFKGSLSQKRVFTYDYNSAAGAERLNKIVKSTPVGEFEQINFFYTWGQGDVKKDKYPLNSEFTGLDKYLPYFSKFSDVLIQQVQITPLPYTNQTRPYYHYFYTINSDGYAIGRNIEYFPLGYGKEAGKQLLYNVYDYSTNWQGI